MATPSVVAPRIHQALADYLKRDVRTITPQQSLREDLGLDSMATIELLFRIEEAFDLQIPDGDLHQLATVSDVTAYVERKLAPASSSPKKAGATSSTSPSARPTGKQPKSKRSSR